MLEQIFGEKVAKALTNKWLWIILAACIILMYLIYCFSNPAKLNINKDSVRTELVSELAKINGDSVNIEIEDLSDVLNYKDNDVQQVRYYIVNDSDKIFKTEYIKLKKSGIKYKFDGFVE
jgi:hypothetical protein